ncbi:olfactomedin-like protein 1 [Ambystoma mexicanum]|uniref:olfactomedin-like protein 1 n=1 Tax=Ambystoma mexicanum TaxID=8296 RepID=UPI0037E9A219
MELFRSAFFVVFAFGLVGPTPALSQDEDMIHYIERRFLSLEGRLDKCDQDLRQFVQEFRVLSRRISSRLMDLSIISTTHKTELEDLAARVDRAEWDIDYVESVTSSKPCIEMDQKLVEQRLEEEAEERRDLERKLNSSCNSMLAGIKSVKIIKKAGDMHGSWMKDSGNGLQEIYFLNGSSNNMILEFSNIESFTENDYMQKAQNVTLPFSWQGSGQILRNGFLFLHLAGTEHEIIKFDMQKMNVTDRMQLLGAGRMPVYQLSPFNKIDLAVDEQGLWAIHAVPNTDENIVITKIDDEQMSIQQVWNTSCGSKNAEAAFIICGTLYVVYNSASGGRSHIECIYDTLGIIHKLETPTLYFPKRYSSHSIIHYNPKELQLYSWDDGYQIIYNVDLKQKIEKP